MALISCARPTFLKTQLPHFIQHPSILLILILCIIPGKYRIPRFIFLCNFTLFLRRLRLARIRR